MVPAVFRAPPLRTAPPIYNKTRTTRVGVVLRGAERGREPAAPGWGDRKCDGGTVVASGLVASLIVFAGGAILDFAITVSPNQHGFNLNTVGVILMIVGVVGAVAS